MVGGRAVKQLLFMLQIHGRGCLRCTYSTVARVSAKASKCTAVRSKHWALRGRHAGEPKRAVPCIGTI